MKRKTPSFVSATDLADMAVCERRVLLTARYGKRHHADVRRSADYGNERHVSFHRDAVRQNPGLSTSAPVDHRCFIASAVFGADAPETVALRQFRDRILLPGRLGRLLIRIYYWASPPVAVWLSRHRSLRRACALALSGMIRHVQQRGKNSE